MSQTAVGKATGGAEPCCASINLQSHWEEHATNILLGCVGMNRYKFHSCASQPGCHLADSTGCLKDWFPFGNSCFSLSLPDLTWAKASDMCKLEGGNLASVHSEEESAFISRMLPNRTCWIGANNVNFEEEWCWSDGSPWKNHSKAETISGERGVGAVGVDFRGNWHRLSTNSKEKHCSVCKLGKETSEDHDGHEQHQDGDKGHSAHSMWVFFWAIPVLFVFCLAVGGAFYAKKDRQKRKEAAGELRMELSSVSTTTSLEGD